MTQVVEIDDREITITPFFKIMEIENIPKSESQGMKVMEMHEVVEVRFAGTKHYAPVFPANEFWKREGNQTITYAQRWAEQYRAFKEGDPQEAMGTPLEMLRNHGVTPEQISLCRALKIYSIEALDRMESPKVLGMAANVLKQAAREFLASRNGSVNQMAEIEALKAQIAELQRAIPAQQTPPDVIDEMLAAVDYSLMDDEALKSAIADKAGSRPRGNPSRQTLENMASELGIAA